MSGNKRYNARRDANEAEIIRTLEQAQCSVLQINEKDAPDLLVGRNGVNFLLEVKSGRSRLTKGQDEFRSAWRGRKPIVVRSPIEAVQAVGIVVVPYPDESVG